MSLVTQAFIFERYGPRLSTEQICELLGITKPALYNQISAGTCRLKTYIDNGKRWADYRDAAAYFDETRKQAA
jgi:hypothetical protein